MEISVENFQEVKMYLPLEAAKHLLAYAHKPRHPTTEITFFSHVSCHFIHNAYKIVANQISFKWWVNNGNTGILKMEFFPIKKNEIMAYSAKWMNLENVIPHKVG